ncbi:hypothetical protein FRC19_002104 [Serendipita sp. 401]|nr:hypothetical protein FRC19_002104 [Serendipita sp. 401]
MLRATTDVNDSQLSFIGIVSLWTIVGLSRWRKASSSQNVALEMVRILKNIRRTDLKVFYAVPVIAIFTKFDALDNRAFNKLKKEGKSRRESRELATQRAVIDFEAIYLKMIYKYAHPPKAHVYLRDMNMEGSKCGELMERTTSSLDDEVLQQLFVSTQRNNVEVCISYAMERDALPVIRQSAKSTVNRDIKRDSVEVKEMIRSMLAWFPQYPVSVKDV